MIFSPWIFVLLAIPVLLLGEFLVRRIKLLTRFNIPAPVVSGLLISVAISLGKFYGAIPADFSNKVNANSWAWFVTAGASSNAVIEVQRPFLVAFFTCLGLNASWTLVKRGGIQVVIFLLVASALAVVQNAAVMVGGHCGFGLGNTSTPIAIMKSLVENFGG